MSLYLSGPSGVQAVGRRRSGGFTLVEMIVAAVVLVLGVVAAMACIGAATRSTGAAADYTTAALLAQQQLSQIEANPSQLTGGDQQGEFGADYPGFSWHQTVETTDVSAVEKVTLVIEWGTGLTVRSAQFVTYVTVPQTSTGVAQ